MNVFVDTNILVYAFDVSVADKNEQALLVMEHLHQLGDRPALSTQCLGEFFTTVCGKIPAPLSKPDALREVVALTKTCIVLDVTPFAVLEACRASDKHQMSYWDALIWAVARLNQVPIILTEDGRHDRVIEGVRYQNPFHAKFDLASIGV